MGRLVEMVCEFQPYITEAPVAPAALYDTACRNDKPTIAAWRDTWLKQIKTNHEKFGPFGDKSVGKLFRRHLAQTCILAGSGPSLAYNGHLLKHRHGAVLVSCLHNFHFFEDRDIHVDYYVSLDAGPVTIEEVAEGGQHDAAWYWERTKGKILLCYVGTHPELIEKWQGTVLFFNCPLPDLDLMAEIDAVERFSMFVSSGGNVLGASTYLAKGVLGCSTLAFVGADFSFSYKNKFHGWDSKYDKEIGACLRVVDVYGNAVKTWPSYNGFKSWFDFVASTIPGVWINCTEGGTFGAYPGGNIMAVRQMELKTFLDMLGMCDHLEDQATNPTTAERKLLF